MNSMFLKILAKRIKEGQINIEQIPIPFQDEVSKLVELNN